jgi:hypothetical protein
MTNKVIHNAPQGERFALRDSGVCDRRFFFQSDNYEFP